MDRPFGTLHVEHPNSGIYFVGLRFAGEMREYQFREGTILQPGKYSVTVDNDGFAVATKIEPCVT